MSSISSITSSTSSTSSTTESDSSSTLSQNDFLQLLVAQIQYQDPLNPQSNTDMAAQLAQFTTLQQSTEMSSSLSMLQANSLIGSTVNLSVDSSTTTSGTVSGVIMSNGTPMITVNGENYLLSQVLSVAPTTTDDTSSTTASSTDTTSSTN